MIADVVGQVMQDTPSCGHATGCQDHHGAMALDQGFGLLGCLDHGGHMVHGLHLVSGEAVFTHVPFEQRRGVNRHRAV